MFSISHCSTHDSDHFKTPACPTLTEDDLFQTTFLKCYTNQQKTELRTIRNSTILHAEEVMLQQVEAGTMELPQEIWLTRSPCENCAIKLLEAYSDNSESPIYPTLYIANIATGKNVEFSINAHYVQSLIELMRNGFNIEVWNLKKIFHRYIQNHTRLMEESEFASKTEGISHQKHYNKAQKCKKKAERALIQLEELQLRLTRCREQLREDSSSAGHSLVAHMGIVPLLYHSPEDATVPGLMQCQCRVILTTCAAGEMQAVKPMVIFRGKRQSHDFMVHTYKNVPKIAIPILF